LPVARNSAKFKELPAASVLTVEATIERDSQPLPKERSVFEKSKPDSFTRVNELPEVIALPLREGGKNDV
jgi:hypothetical protein